MNLTLKQLKSKSICSTLTVEINTVEFEKDVLDKGSYLYDLEVDHSTVSSTNAFTNFEKNPEIFVLYSQTELHFPKIFQCWNLETYDNNCFKWARRFCMHVF